jgi:hypothetical protein
LVLAVLLGLEEVVVQVEAQELILFSQPSHLLVEDMGHGINKLVAMVVLAAVVLVQLQREVTQVAQAIRQAQALAKVIVVELRVNILVQAAVVQVLLGNPPLEEVQMEKVATGQHLL